jgi:hypothetical protein
MTCRARLLDLLIPLSVVGPAALAARLMNSTDDGSPALYLVSSGLALLTGFWRPGLSGSIGAWIGWSAGLAVGWWIDTGDLWIGGPAAYGLIVALAPHAITSLLRKRLRSRGTIYGA